MKSKARPKTKEEEREMKSKRESVFSKGKHDLLQAAIAAKNHVEQLKKDVPILFDSWTWETVFRNKAIEESNKVFYLYSGDEEKVINHAKRLLEQYETAKNDFISEMEELDDLCNDERMFWLSPNRCYLDDPKVKQVTVYVNHRTAQTLKSLGYRIHEYKKLEDRREWSNEYLNYQYSKVEVTHLCIKIDYKVFVSACKNNRLLPMGKYVDDCGNEVELKRGRSKGCSNDHLTKSITLLNQETNEILKFNSLLEVANHFGMTKGNVSRSLKGKSVGDVVRLKKVKFKII